MDNFWWAEQLMAERGAKNLSREEVSGKSGVAVSTIRRMELGERAGTIDNLADLCKVYGISLTTFFQRAEERRDLAPVSPIKTKKAARKDKGPDDWTRQGWGSMVAPDATVQKKAARKQKDPDA